jgi:predicted ATPase
MPASVGLRGEHTANLVLRNYQKIRTQLNHWIKRFEFGDRIKLKKISAGYFSLWFEGGRARTGINIADAGFGASQILPLIVQAATAREASLTICEQPEIHLNPRLQYVLADLFAEMANNRRRVIVETHSEHLLLRLRHLIAQGRIDSERVALYFVEMSNGIASIREIPVEGNGHIPSEEWPKGFFEDSLRESFALATAQIPTKRRTGPGRSEGKC